MNLASSLRAVGGAAAAAVPAATALLGSAGSAAAYWPPTGPKNHNSGNCLVLQADCATGYSDQVWELAS